MLKVSRTFKNGSKWLKLAALVKVAAKGKTEPHLYKWLQMVKVSRTFKSGFKW